MTPETKWFYRSGLLHRGPVSKFDEKKGTAQYGYVAKCGRCGGAGGGQQWAHTGWTCYECGGSGSGGHQIATLYTAERLAKLNAAQAKRDAKKAIKDAAKKAIWEAEKQAFLKTKADEFTAAYPDVSGLLESFAGQDEIIADMRGKLQEYGSLSEKQVAFAQKIIEGLKAKAAAVHVGEVGKRITLTLTVDKVHIPEAPPVYSRYQFAPSSIYICHDQDGNKIVYRGGGNSMPYKGETAEMVATVKEHSFYHGEAQTVIARPKLVKKIVSLYDDPPVAPAAVAEMSL